MITPAAKLEIDAIVAEMPERVYPLTLPDGTEFQFRTELARTTYLNNVGKVNETTGKERAW